MLVVASVAAIMAATLVPQVGQPETTPLCIICGSLGGVDAVLNFLLFFPLGVGLGLVGLRPFTALIAILLLSTGIELAQFFLISGRDASIGDVLTNVVGGAAGFFIALTSGVWRRPPRSTALRLAMFWGALWLALQVASAYSFSPALPSSNYYGQIARVFEHMATFGGEVLSATIDTVSVPNFGFAKTEQLRAALRNGAPVGAIVIPAGPTRGIAPIVRIADERQREIVQLGQDHSDLVFTHRTGAAVLRLRQPIFVMREVFPAIGDGARIRYSDTLDIRARYGRSVVEMWADSGDVARQHEIAVYPALGWILFFPSRWYVEGTSAELAVSLVWLAGWLIPLGYWLFFVVRSRQGRPPGERTPAFYALAILLALGLVGAPFAFGMSPASLAECVAVAVGLLVGAFLGKVDRRAEARRRAREG